MLCGQGEVEKDLDFKFFDFRVYVYFIILCQCLWEDVSFVFGYIVGFLDEYFE